jgi:hypothetical protein
MKSLKSLISLNTFVEIPVIFQHIKDPNGCPIHEIFDIFDIFGGGPVGED